MTLEEAIQSAERELSWLTIEDVQGATAMTWAGRAIFAYRDYMRSGSNTAFSNAIEFHHEALEHASGAAPGVLELIREPLRQAAEAAGVNR